MKKESIRKKKSVDKNREYLQEYKVIRGCNRCAEDRDWVLEFHHIDSCTKIKTINRIIKSHGLKNFKKEVEKYELMCANCHRDLHYQERIKL